MAFIVLEGLDGSGKGTQIKLLHQALLDAGQDCVKITFPDYESPSSSLVKMYLKGEFGSDPQDVGPYAACSFYAVDRYASYRKSWKGDLDAGRVVLADRYTTSNIVYQMTKLPQEQWMDFIAWVEDFEYEKLGLPRPDRVIYLDMPPQVSQRLLSGRYQGDDSKKDIHESHIQFLLDCRKTALFAAEKLGWQVIGCAQGDSTLGDTPRTVADIAREVFVAAQSGIKR